MYHGVYEGAAAEAQEKKILILGESHHDLDSSITTQEVVEDYLSPENTTKQSLQFFHKIALAFGVDTGKVEEKAQLWDKVFFGNYINKSLDGPSGEGDETAQTLIAANKDRYNQDLVDFIKAHAIETVFCFSNRVFDALPNEEGHGSWALFQDVKCGKADLWFGRGYGPDSPFCRELKVYGVPHPRYWNCAGIKPEELAQYIRPIFEDCCG